jgi:hypothetical protein
MPSDDPPYAERSSLRGTLCSGGTVVPATSSGGGEAKALVGQLVLAAQCPRGSRLPPGTAGAAWQLSEMILSVIHNETAAARDAQIEQLLSAVGPLIEAEKAWKYQLDDAVTVEEAMALKWVPMAVMGACDAVRKQCDMADVMNWFCGLDPAPEEFMRDYATSGQLRRIVRMVANPAATVRDRVAAANLSAMTTFKYFNGPPSSTAGRDATAGDGGAPKKMQQLQQVLIDSGLVCAFAQAQLAALPSTCCVDADTWLQFGDSCHIATGWLSTAMGISTAEHTPECYADVCRHFIDCGVGKTLCRFVEMFESCDPAGDARVTPWFALCLCVLQLLGQDRGTGRRILTECCTSRQVRHLTPCMLNWQERPAQPMKTPR